MTNWHRCHRRIILTDMVAIYNGERFIMFFSCRVVKSECYLQLIASSISFYPISNQVGNKFESRKAIFFLMLAQNLHRESTSCCFGHVFSDTSCLSFGFEFYFTFKISKTSFVIVLEFSCCRKTFKRCSSASVGVRRLLEINAMLLSQWWMLQVTCLCLTRYER